MTDTRSRPTVARYTITPDRAGHALAAGGLAIGMATVMLLVAGGAREAASLAIAAMLGSFLGLIAIVAVGGPVWLACHALGRVGPRSAASAGFAIALLLAGFAQALSPADETAGAAWARGVTAVASSLGIALIGAGVAVLMWRIAYRREGAEDLSRP